MMGYDDANWGGPGWLAMSLAMLLFWAVLAGLVVWAVRNVRTTGERFQPLDRRVGADEILAERYARGDIDEVEYQHRRGLLHGSQSSHTER